MDGKEFDALARFVATPRSRRQVVRALGGSILASLAASGRVGAASCPSGVVCSAHCCPNASDVCLAGQCTSCPSGVICSAQCCAAGQQCISGQCTSCPSGVICSGACCAAGETCQAGQCAAAATTTPAPTTTPSPIQGPPPPTTTTTAAPGPQPGPCGGVGDSCSAGAPCCAPNVCGEGACAAACPPGYRECDGVCYPGGCCTVADCGTICQVCGADHVCRPCEQVGLVCQNGACAPATTTTTTTPPPPTTTTTTTVPPPCGPGACPGCCAASGACPAGTSEAACGAGGAACAACRGGQVCHQGSCCAPQCAGKTCGDDGCGGSCGTCPSGQTCLRQSVAGAPAGQCCVPLTCQYYMGYCGYWADGCGDSIYCSCPAGEICCPPGTDCAGRCCRPAACPPGANCGTLPDGCGGTATCGPANCAGTGQTCGGGGTPNVCGCTPRCAGKTCGDDGCGGSCGTCPSGQTCCGGACADLSNDVNHCGDCAAACSGGEDDGRVYACEAGRCIATGCQPGFTICGPPEGCCTCNDDGKGWTCVR